MKQITEDDKEALREMALSEKVYRYEPTFLYERKYRDIGYVIAHMYDESQEESLFLGVYEDGHFCGIAEFYGYKDAIHKISVGCRFLERYWGRGLATRTVKLMVDFLYRETHIEIIAASTLPENKASANVLRKNGFVLVVHESDEDWGYEKPLPTDKWIR